MPDLARTYFCLPFCEATIWKSDGTLVYREAEAWVEYIGPFASRQLIVLVPDTDAGSEPWLWNSSYTGILTDQPPEKSTGEIGQVHLDSDGRLIQQRIAPDAFETAWTASFVCLARMVRRSESYRWKIDDFQGEAVEIEF